MYLAKISGNEVLRDFEYYNNFEKLPARKFCRFVRVDYWKLLQDEYTLCNITW